MLSLSLYKSKQQAPITSSSESLYSQKQRARGYTWSRRQVGSKVHGKAYASSIPGKKSCGQQICMSLHDLLDV